jgi:hypothetical protein
MIFNTHLTGIGQGMPIVIRPSTQNIEDGKGHLCILNPQIFMTKMMRFKKKNVRTKIY